MPELRSRFLFGWLALACVLWGCANSAENSHDITVFGAASTADALTELAEVWRAQTGQRVRLSFASSSTLARQIENGAPADIFLSANPSWMDYLEMKGLLASGTRRDLLSNRLVLISPKGAEPHFDLSPGAPPPRAYQGLLAVGDPKHVPAGIYARQALIHLGWWSAFEKRLAPARDVRTALLLVESGEVGLGLVYATDAQASGKITLLGRLPADLHDPITYPLALCRGNEETPGFYKFLLSSRASTLFRSYGFGVE